MESSDLDSDRWKNKRATDFLSQFAESGEMSQYFTIASESERVG